MNNNLQIIIVSIFYRVKFPEIFFDNLICIKFKQNY